MGQIGAPLVGSYDYRLVVLAVLIAILASYVALELAVRVTAARGRLRRAWLAGGAISMGLGIWSTHFVGMLAFRLSIPVRYDLPTVLLSLLAAIFASAVALYIVSGEKFGRRGPRFEVGVGIPSMHERVKLIGGRLEIDSTGHGTTVPLTIPLRGERT
jgi:NO-binding membrane sensor protein with MHYT domain